MDNFETENWQIIHAKAPENMFEQVRERIVSERIARVKTHQQLTIGVVLLLFVAFLNISIIHTIADTKRRLPQDSARVLYETYFDNNLNIQE